ncbi:conjugal transfer protein TraX [Clostridioides mangenotii]|nr:conjugal transfer protein TraX [Clostridioides mangenotii]
MWFGYLGKIAAPIFFYLIVEGFFHTRSRKKYLERLAVFGIIMIGVDKLLGIHNNIFLSLTLSVAIMMLIEYFKTSGSATKKIISIIALIALGGAYMFTEGSIFGLGMTLIFYFLKEKKIPMAIVYVLFSLCQVIENLSSPEMYDQLFIYDYQWMMVFAILPILMYNGKLGLKNKFTKWMFYIFYPAHLAVIVLIANRI